MINITMIISYLITKNKDKKCKHIYENKETLVFLRKDMDLHAHHVFEMRDETEYGHIYIYVVDRNSIQLIIKGLKISYKNKEMPKYKYAKKLLDYLTDNLNKWKL